MSKRDLKKYISGLTKRQLEEQFLEMYDKFPDVKVYYDFVFNPREDKLVQEARAKISNEYFPIKSKRAKLRRSIAQKFIKHFKTLGVEPHSVAEIMFYNIEIAQKYTAKREMRYGSFYKSMLKSFDEAVSFITTHSIENEFVERAEAISAESKRQRWENFDDFLRIVEHLHFLKP